MEVFEAIPKQWGNSLGVTIPKEILEKEHIKKNQKVTVMLIKTDNVLKRTFGMFKGRTNKTAQQIKDEIRKELHDIE